MEVSDFVATLASGAALGALVSGLVQFLLASRQRKWERDDALRERRRAVYEGYLTHVMTLSTRFVRDWTKHGDGLNFAEESRLAYEDLRVRSMLVASPEVQGGLKDIEDAIVQWREHLADSEFEDGVSFWTVLDREWEAKVMPSIRRVSAIMAAELEP